MQKSLRVMHISSDYPPHALWGMGIYVETLQNGFSKYHSDIDSCVATASKSFAESGVCVTTKKDDDLLFLTQDKTAIFDNFSNFLLWQDRLADEILSFFRDNSPVCTVLHSNNWMSWLTAKKVRNSLNLPIVSSVHFLQKQYEGMLNNPIPTYHNEIIEIENEMLSDSNAIICFSDESEKMVREVYAVERDDIFIIPHSSRILVSGTEEPQVRHNMLYLGRLTLDKGILEVIQVVEYVREKYPDVHLHIVGDGELYNKIAERQSPFITLHGYIYDAQKIKSIAEDCALSLLLSTSDVFPISVIDSMACGCVPVLSNRDTVSRMFEDGVSGIRVNNDNLAEAANIIVDLLDDEGKLIEMRKNVKNYYTTHYSLDTLLNSTRAVYEGLINK